MSTPEAPTIAWLASQVFLSPMQRQKVDRSIAHLEHTIASAAHMPAGAVAPNIERLEENLRRDRQMLSSGTPPEYSPAMRNKLFSLGKEIVTSITSDEDFLTHEEMDRGRPRDQSRLLRFEKRHKKKILALKSLRRILDPTNDDMDFTSIAQFRRDKPPLGNPQRYWAGFDGIQWESDTEETLLENLDDATYLAFLELKVQGWAQATIQKQLGLTEKLYQACMQRTRAASLPEHVADGDNADSTPEIPPPTPPKNRTATPAHVAARAVGVEPLTVREDAQKNWPLSELQLFAMPVNEFCRKFHLNAGMLYRVARGKIKSPDILQKIKDALEVCRQQHMAKNGGVDPYQAGVHTDMATVS